jgi:hypothetical protein
VSAAAKQKWWEEKQAAKAARAARSKAARPIGHSADSITWLRKPVMIGSVPVVGVCADASAETKAQFDV